jgi:hypothetical protein
MKMVYFDCIDCKTKVEYKLPNVYPTKVTCPSCHKTYTIHILPDGVIFKLITIPETNIGIKE